MLIWLFINRLIGVLECGMQYEWWCNSDGIKLNDWIYNWMNAFRSLAEVIRHLDEDGAQEMALSLLEGSGTSQDVLADVFHPADPAPDTFQTANSAQWDPWKSYSSVLASAPPSSSGNQQRIRRSNSLTPPSAYPSDLWSKPVNIPGIFSSKEKWFDRRRSWWHFSFFELNLIRTITRVESNRDHSRCRRRAKTVAFRLDQSIVHCRLKVRWLLPPAGPIPSTVTTISGCLPFRSLEVECEVTTTSRLNFSNQFESILLRSKSSSLDLLK